jgi:hypothetical protein
LMCLMRARLAAAVRRPSGGDSNAGRGAPNRGLIGKARTARRRARRNTDERDNATAERWCNREVFVGLDMTRGPGVEAATRLSVAKRLCFANGTPRGRPLGYMQIAWALSTKSAFRSSFEMDIGVSRASAVEPPPAALEWRKIALKRAGCPNPAEPES